MPGRSLRAALLIPLIALCVSCGAFAVGRDDLIGDFQADYGFGVEALRLARDGHYDQLFREEGEDTWTSNSGQWEFKGGAIPALLLHDSLRVQDGGVSRPAYREPVPGIRTFQIRKGWRTIEIVEEGGGPSFRKVR
jgi:hypothetical protein